MRTFYIFLLLIAGWLTPLSLPAQTDCGTEGEGLTNNYLIKRIQAQIPGIPGIQTIIVQQIGEHLLYDGDITVKEYSKLKIAPRGAVVSDINFLWTDATIPYTIENKNGLVFFPAQVDSIEKAIEIINTYTNLYLRPARGNEDYVAFVPNQLVASSDVGRQGGRQEITLTYCALQRVYAIIHEIMHTAGFYHEQMRDDRNVYVYINQANIAPGSEQNFSIMDSSKLSWYNFGSIMHYARTDGSSNGQPVITVKNGSKIGFLNFLSAGDVVSINKLYPSISSEKNSLSAYANLIFSPGIYTYLNPKLSEFSYLKQEQILWLEASEIMRLQKIDPLLRGGIKAYFRQNRNSKVKLELYTYDETKPDGFGILLYGCFSDQAPEEPNRFEEQSWTFSPVNNSQIVKFQSSIDLKGIFLGYFAAGEWGINTIINPGRETRIANNLRYRRIPVVVKLTIEGEGSSAIVNRIKLPIFGELDVSNLTYVGGGDGGELRVVPKDAPSVPTFPTMSVYPNPTSGELTLRVEEQGESDATIRLVDFSGKQVYTQPVALSKGTQEISLGNLKAKGISAGVYFLQVVSPQRNSTVKVVMQ